MPRLQAMDPASASRIHPNNLPRIIRALEIVQLTGRPVPSEPRRRPVEALRLGLELERSALHRVADRRIDDQIRMGLVQEVEMLLAMGYAPTLPALDGLGYRQMIQYLKGEARSRRQSNDTESRRINTFDASSPGFGEMTGSHGCRSMHRPVKGSVNWSDDI